MELQSTLVATGALPNVKVEPRGFEPRSQDFQSCAYTRSAKAPWFVTRERLELPTPTFVASCSDPTELTSQSAEAEGFEPSEPFGPAR